MEDLLRLFIVALVAFSSELISSVFGGGYGTILTPTLVLLGYELSLAVPCTLISQLISGLFLVAFHHRLGTIKVARRSEDVRVAGILALCGLVGVVVAALALVSLPAPVVDAYVAIVILIVGLVVLLRRNARSNPDGPPSLKKLVALGILSAFNKGISGGGYGPLLSGGQVASGTGVRSAIGRMLLAEVVVCLGGVMAYAFLRAPLDLPLVLSATLGSTLMAPLSAHAVRRTGEKKLKIGMGLLITALGLAMMVRVLTSL